LHDSELAARAGAARAIACGNRREAELLMRSKILAGDPEPGVIGECFAGLLAVEPEESVAFVARYLDQADEAIRELAALALGESRLESAFDRLRAAWDAVLVDDGMRRTLIRAAALNRSEAAFSWLLSLAAEARAAIVESVIDALAIYKRNAKLAGRLREALQSRGDAALEQRFRSVWDVD
jgi:hypothetical protein